MKIESTGLTDEQLKDLKEKVSKNLSIDRTLLVVDFPFTGGILMRLNLIPTRDFRVRTACTDGNDVYFDIDFYSRLTQDERRFVLAHETWHCVMMHMLRREGRDPDLWNIAIDMEVNHILKEAGMPTLRDALYPDYDMAGKNAEEIYEMLLKNANKAKKNASQGNKTGKLSGQFDKHMSNDGQDRDGQGDQEGQDGDESGQNDSNGSGGQYPFKDKWGNVGIDPDFKPKISKDLSEKMREAVISEAQKIERNQGTLPGCIKNYINELRKPEIKWQEVLAQFVTQCYAGSRKWLPPNRRHVYNGTYLQSRRSERISCVVAIDTSGSCIDALPKFFGELNSLMNSFGNYDLTVMMCDTEVTSFETYDADSPFDGDDKVEWSGGGGTSFCPPFEELEARGITPDCFIYLTDGYGDAPEQKPDYPVLWVLTSDGSMDFCKWGTKIRFKNDGRDRF